jgi:hypothetical protein
MTEVTNLKGKTRMEVNTAMRMKKPYVRNFNEDAASLAASQKRCQWTLMMIKFDKYSILLNAESREKEKIGFVTSASWYLPPSPGLRDNYEQITRFCCSELSSDDGGSTYLCNVGRQLFYTAVHPRRKF